MQPEAHMPPDATTTQGSVRSLKAWLCSCDRTYVTHALPNHSRDVERAFVRLVDPAAVSAFADDEVGGGHRPRRMQHWHAATAEVAGEGDALLTIGNSDGQCDHRGAEQMAGVEKPDLEVGGGGERLI